MPVSDKYILAMDFDGVLFDSSDEKLYTGYNSYLAINSNTCLFEGESLTHHNFKQKIAAHKEIVIQFRRFLDFIGIAGENAVVFELIENKIDIFSYDKFVALVDAIDRDRYDAYHRMVLTKRQEYSTHNNSQYMGLIKPYHDITEAIRKETNQLRKIICTMKPRENVEVILEEHGLQFTFDDIISIKSGQEKISVLEKYANHAHLEHSKIYFLDDNIHHLKDRNKTDINCFLASWGYHVPENNFGDHFPEAQTLSISDFKQLVNSFS